MAPQKAKLSHVSDDSSRKTTLLEGKDEIPKMKKVSKYSKEATQVTGSNQTSPIIDESENENQKSNLMQRIVEAKYQLEKKRKENREEELTLCMFECIRSKKLPENLTIKDLKDLEKVIDQYTKDIENRLANMDD